MDEVMSVTVGATESTVMEPVDTAFARPLTSVKEPAGTVIVTEPFAPDDGVKVAEYEVPEPEKFDKDPLPTVTELAVKSVDARERVKVIVAVVVPPMEVGDAVMVADGKLLSSV